MEFKEKQHLKLWCLYLHLAAGATLVLCILIFDIGEMSFQQLRESYFAPVLAVLISFVIIILVQQSKLTTLINQDSITYKHAPFHGKSIEFKWLSLDKVYIRKYNAICEYGGYGIKTRFWFKFRDKAYILNGKNKGLQHEFKDGKRLLLSSNKIEELEMFLINLKTRYNIQAIE